MSGRGGHIFPEQRGRGVRGAGPSLGLRVRAGSRKRCRRRGAGSGVLQPACVASLGRSRAVLLPRSGAAALWLSSPDLGGRPAALQGCAFVMICDFRERPCRVTYQRFPDAFLPPLLHCLESCSFPCVIPCTPICKEVPLNLNVCSFSHLVIVTMYRM